MKRKTITIGLVSMFLLINAIQISASSLNEEDTSNEGIINSNGDITIHVYARIEETGDPIKNIGINIQHGKYIRFHEKKYTNSNGYCKFEGDYYFTNIWPIFIYPSWLTEYGEHIRPGDIDSNNECTIYFYISESDSIKTKTKYIPSLIDLLAELRVQFPLLQHILKL